MTLPVIDVARDFDDILADAMKVRNNVLRDTENPETNWRATLQADGESAAHTFQSVNSALYPVPKQSISRDEVEFFTSYSREKSVPIDARLENYFQTGLLIEQAEEALEDYDTQVSISRECEASSINEALEKIDSSNSEIKLDIEEPGHSRDYAITTLHDDGFGNVSYTGYGNEFASEIENKLAEHSLLQ